MIAEQHVEAPQPALSPQPRVPHSIPQWRSHRHPSWAHLAAVVVVVVVLAVVVVVVVVAVVVAAVVAVVLVVVVAYRIAPRPWVLLRQP